MLPWLNQFGYKVKVVSVRENHTIANVVRLILIKIGYWDNWGKLQRLGVFRIWDFIQLVGMIPSIIRTHLYIQFGYIVIAERFTFDTVLGMSFLKETEKYINSRTSRIMLQSIPADALVIFFTADYQALKKRRKNIEPKSFVEWQSKIGFLISNVIRSDNCVLDVTHTSAPEVFEIIKKRMTTP